MDLSNAEAALKRFQQEPECFFKEVLGVTLENYQREALLALAANERVAIAACHDLGKTYLMARSVVWFATCFPYSKVITTAPTFNQVKNVLWAEIRSAHARAKFPLGGKLNLTDWQLSRDGDWFAMGFTPKTEVSGGEGQGTQSSFQGFHAPYLLVLFDEATGVVKNVWTMAEGLLTSQNVKFGAIGNPTSKNSEFYRCFKSPAWTKIHLSCFNSPNFVANGIVNITQLRDEVQRVREMNDIEAQARMRSYLAPKPHLLTVKWCVARILDWGFDHPLTISKILGQFPEEGENTLMPLGRIEDAQIRLYWPLPSDRKIIGIDVARFGTDLTVLTSMHGKKVLEKRVLMKRDTGQVTGEAIAMARALGGGVIFVVDETGVGGGVVDSLNAAIRDKLLDRDCEVRGVQFGAACEEASDKEKYYNLKARIFDLLAQDIAAEDGIQLLDESIYLEELPTILYFFDAKGRKRIESKDEYKKRTGRGSPDTSDSLALANFGRYDESTSGSFPVTEGEADAGFAKPFAAGLGATKQW